MEYYNIFSYWLYIAMTQYDLVPRLNGDYWSILMLTVLTLIVQGMVLIALISFFDSMTLEDEFSSDEVEPETEIHEYSTYIKLRRMGRLLNSDSELKMMKEKNFICCLDLFLELLIRNCQLPGCMNVPKANYYFVSTIPLL